MSEFVQCMLILAVTIIAIVAIISGRLISTKLIKRDDSVHAELSVTQEYNNDIKKEK